MHKANTSTCSTKNGYKNIREDFNAGNAICFSPPPITAKSTPRPNGAGRVSI